MPTQLIKEYIIKGFIMDNSVNKLPARESMTVEFKSDRSGFPDDDLVGALICLANTKGGELWLGVEDDGMPSGLHTSHTDLFGLSDLIASRTRPPLFVTVTLQILAGIEVERMVVPKSNTLIATVDGVCLRRHLKNEEKPERLIANYEQSIDL